MRLLRLVMLLTTIIIFLACGNLTSLTTTIARATTLQSGSNRDDIVQKASDGWRVLDEFDSATDLTGILGRTRGNNSDDNYFDSLNISYRHKAQLLLVETNDLSSQLQPTKRIYGFNDRYNFHVVNKPGNDKALVVLKISPIVDRAMEEFINDTVSRYYAPCLWLVDRPLTKWIKDPSFRIVRADSQVNNAVSSFTAICNFTIRDGDDVEPWKANLTFDQNNNWAILKCEAKTIDNKKTIITNIEYSDESIGNVKPFKSVTRKLIGPGGQLGERFVIKTLSPSKLREKDVTLSAFGFSEPHEFEKNTEWTLWTIVGFATVITIVILGSQLRRRACLIAQRVSSNI